MHKIEDFKDAPINCLEDSCSFIINKIRKTKGVKQGYFVDKLKLSQSYTSQLLTQKKKMSLSQIDICCQILQIKTSKIITLAEKLKNDT